MGKIGICSDILEARIVKGIGVFQVKKWGRFEAMSLSLILRLRQFRSPFVGLA
jgi:hypothetical protein